jgi:DNA-binding transcriptional LysR family regulator
VEQIERISHRLKFQHLNVLLAVAQTGSMAKAARHLSISQPVVSKVIAELESMLGVRLFDRSPQGVEPTLYGHILLKRSVAIFDDLRTSVGEIEFVANSGVGELRIGTTEPQAGIVATVIERLSRQYPGIDYTVVLAERSTLIDRELRRRKIDLMISPVLKPSLEDDLAATILYDNCLRVVVGIKSRWGQRRKVSLSDLIKEPWCMVPVDVGSRALVVDAFHVSGLPLPRIIVSCASNHLCHRMLADGRFVGISGDGSIYFDVHAPLLKVLPVELPASPLTIAVLTLRNRTITPMAQLFIDCARDVTKVLAKGRPGQAGHR